MQSQKVENTFYNVFCPFNNMTVSISKKKIRKAANVVHDSLPQSKYFFLKQLLALFTVDDYFRERIIELQGITGTKKKCIHT